MATAAQPDYEAIIIGAGVAGIYQIKRLAHPRTTNGYDRVVRRGE